MRRRVWLLALVFPLAGCAARAAVPPPVLVLVPPSVMVSAVPAESFDRTDLRCYYGVVW